MKNKIIKQTYNGYGICIEEKEINAQRYTMDIIEAHRYGYCAELYVDKCIIQTENFQHIYKFEVYND